jgi:glycine C-acetyltransferase
MPHHRLDQILAAELDGLERAGRLKGPETVVAEVIPAANGKGPRYRLAGDGRTYLRMNSNSYLGLSLNEEILVAEEDAVRAFGSGPGAVRFISGTWAPHVALERRLAAFHGREAAMIFSSAYAAMMGALVPLITPETAVISDALNHNCIINAIRLGRPKERHVYPHLDLGALEDGLRAASQTCRRAIIVTDGVFSMRGDHAPLDEILDLARQHDESFAENVLVVVDDSHGVGAFGTTGRGTEEVANGGRADLLVATLGKAFGVNGGYVVADGKLVEYLRETAPFYIYSNPITPGEAAAAHRAVEIVDGSEGRALLSHLRDVTARFKHGLAALGMETIVGEHPIAPLIVRDTARTSALVATLRENGILATGLGYPEEEIRFQLSADHTVADIDEALDLIAAAAAATGALRSL